MSARELRLRAAAHDSVADRLGDIAARLTGKLEHLRKSGAWDEARLVEIGLSATIRAEERAYDRALDLRVEAARLEHHAAHSAAMREIAA
jgi:hypothetical protein